MPRISIIIPVYNTAKYLRECLDSVLAQTYRDFEVICVDDGSTDESLEILREYEREFHSSTSTSNFDFKIIPCEHSNAGHCRNVGYAASSGEYLLFLDADDVFAPELLETLHGALLKNHADIAICGHRDFPDGEDYRRCFVREANDQIQVHHDAAKSIDIFSRWVGWAWDKLITRSLIDRYSLTFQEQQSTNDLLFAYSAMTLSSTIVECKSSLIAHRKHAGSIESGCLKTPRCLLDALEAYDGKMRELGVFPSNSQLERYFRYDAFKKSFHYLDQLTTPESVEKIFPAMQELLIRWDLLSLMTGYDNRIWRERTRSLQRSRDATDYLRRERSLLTKLRRKFIALTNPRAYIRRIRPYDSPPLHG